MSSTRPDPRVNAIREDIVDEALKDYVEGRVPVKARQARVIEHLAPVRRDPRFDAPLDTQALYGETVSVFAEAEGWSWVQKDQDRYVGYVPTDCIRLDLCEPDHRISVLQTFVYPAPNIKTPPLTTLPMNALFKVVRTADRFLELSDGAFVFASHAVPVNEYETDYVSVAEKFKGAPYLWGGCTVQGIDCSGLVQTSLTASGVYAPRDSDMQEEQIGVKIGQNVSDVELRRGDLIFWKGHVGIMTDPDTLLHANGYHMLTVAEPVKTAVQRIADMYGTVTSVKRI